MKKSKITRLLVTMLAIVLVFAFATTALAADQDWSTFGQVKQSTTTYAVTCAIQMALYSYDNSTISSYLGVDSDGYGDGYDGSWGTGTNNAVKKFQSYCSLTADGIVGTRTWGALRSNCFNKSWYAGTDYTIGNSNWYNYILINGNYYYGRNYGFYKYTSSDVWQVFDTYALWASFEW